MANVNSFTLMTKHLRTLFICLLSSKFIMSAPTPTDIPEYWINPCGLHPDTYATDGVEVPSISVTEVEVLKDVVRHANVAYRQITDVKKDLVESSGIEEDSLSEYKYDWLPMAPVPDVHYFKKLQRNEAVKDSFQMVQSYAVAIEEMVNNHDAKTDEDIAYTKIKEIRIKSIQLLCSMQLAMIRLNIAPHDQPRRTLMPQDYRNLPHSGQIHRNLIIARDYIKVTFYVKELFKYFSDVE